MGMTILQAMLELNRLSAAITAKRDVLRECNLISESVVNEIEDFTIDTSAEEAEAAKLYGDLCQLLDAKDVLQSNITAANARTGIDTLLSTRNSLKTDIALLKSILPTAGRYGNATVKAKGSRVPYNVTANSGKIYWKHDVAKYAVAAETINSAITDLANELQEVEAKIAELNSSQLREQD